MAKKGNGEGSVHKLPNGRWRAQYYVETPKGRKRRSVSAATKQEARRLMMRGMYESQGIVEFDAATLTVGKYLRQWLESSAGISVAPRTFANYDLQVERHIIPALGHLRLDKLTSLRVQAMCNAKIEAGLKPSTIPGLRGRAYVKAVGVVDRAVLGGLDDEYGARRVAFYPPDVVGALVALEDGHVRRCCRVLCHPAFLVVYRCGTFARASAHS